MRHRTRRTRRWVGLGTTQAALGGTCPATPPTTTTMSSRYDSRTTIFSPEGRLYQVEYAMEAISHAGTALGILAKDGIVLAAEKKVTSKLLEQDTSAEKMYKLSRHIMCAVAGIDSDASTLVDLARKKAQNYLATYDEEIPVEVLVKELCDVMQGYTQHGGLRPFGVSFIYAGWDRHQGYQLYQSNPSGNYTGWLATSVGANNSSAQTLLKQEYKDGSTLDEACGQAMKVLANTMDAAMLTSNKLEFATVEAPANDIKLRVWNPAEIDVLVKKEKPEEGQN